MNSSLTIIRRLAIYTILLAVLACLASQFPTVWNGDEPTAATLLEGSIIAMLGGLFVFLLASFLQSALPPTRVPSEADQALEPSQLDLSIPGQFLTVRGEVFRHGFDPESSSTGFRESRWIAFDGVRLRVTLYSAESGERDRITFCGKDAPNCPEARDWACRLLKANGVMLPRQANFESFCRKLGWGPDAIEVMLLIYPH